MTEFFIKAVTITIGAAVLFGTPNVEKNLPIGYEEVYAAVGDTFEFEGIKYEVIDENNCGVISKNYTGEISIPEKAIFDDREYNVTSIVYMRMIRESI
ncbi:MAG: hypothetical protein IJ736_16485 [Firmicutes bacterium]|nr:hypothetical protein [Bacillota bacterium]